MRQKTKQEIEIDFKRAIEQAQELEHLAEDLSRVANNEVESALLVLKNNWRGDSGGSIELAGRKTIGEIYGTADDLMQIARNIRSVAEVVYRAEKKAADICF